MLGPKKVLIMVPAFSEEKNIRNVIKELRETMPGMDVVIIDDGSKDRTRELCINSGVKVLKHPFNMGYGVTIQTGYKYAVEYGYDIIIQMDGDNQHDPTYIGDLLEAMEHSGVDVVIGSRFLADDGKKWPFLRRIGIRIFSTIAGLIAGQRITDSTSGFQALNRKAFTFFSKLDNFPYDYPDANALITLYFAGLKIREVPVSMRDRLHGSSMNTGIKTLLYVSQMFISIMIVLLRKKKFKACTPPKGDCEETFTAVPQRGQAGASVRGIEWPTAG